MITLRSLDPAGKAFKRRGHLIRRDIAGRAQSITDDGKVDPFNHLLPSGVVMVRHSKPPFLAALHQVIREELLLALKIVVHGLMVIEMFGGEIGKDDPSNWHP